MSAQQAIHMTDTSKAPNVIPYEFSRDWFSGNLPTWRQIVDKNKPRKILEIGSFEGRSTVWMMEYCSIAVGGDIEIWCADTWGGGIEHQKGGRIETDMSDVERRFDRNIEIARGVAPHKVDIHKLKTFSNLAMAKLIADGKTEYFDLVYIDGSHQAPDVLMDAVMAFQVLKVGGIMIFDDYLWSMDAPGTQDVLKMPKPAIDAFMNIFQRKMNIFMGAPIGQLYTRKINP
ncbi:MAG: class I SAM-dependent methyltransferase [Phenylobacterium sp.]|uniref:class I SAM-dependent methyltransferase n=1 Tax=Phenylobacterium sp. TaxID=1871053 RepID=UPI00272F3AE3|nr:class I SAM-dependent methyltransferase [Phenylobacterium sp.]MDP2009232.1 class I SAM-dependent methyltransferase [Phenylobacterium sp.]